MAETPPKTWRRGLLVALLAAPVPLGAVPCAADTPATAQAAAPAWERVRSDDGIVVERREIPGSPIIAFRGYGYVDAPLLKVASVLVDINRSTEWIDSLKEVRRLRQVSQTESIQWNHIGTPIVMKDREFVVSTKLEVDDARHRLVIKIHSVEDPAAPKTDYIRGELMNSSFVLTPVDDGKRTRVDTEIHCDPKGDVAKWIVNMFQKNWPYNTLTRLRAQVSKPDIQIHQELAATLAQRGFFK